MKRIIIILVLLLAATASAGPVVTGGGGQALNPASSPTFVGGHGAHGSVVRLPLADKCRA